MLGQGEVGSLWLPVVLTSLLLFEGQFLHHAPFGDSNPKVGVVPAFCLTFLTCQTQEDGPFLPFTYELL